MPGSAFWRYVVEEPGCSRSNYNAVKGRRLQVSPRGSRGRDGRRQLNGSKVFSGVVEDAFTRDLQQSAMLGQNEMLGD